MTPDPHPELSNESLAAQMDREADGNEAAGLTATATGHRLVAARLRAIPESAGDSRLRTALEAALNEYGEAQELFRADLRNEAAHILAKMLRAVLSAPPQAPEPSKWTSDGKRLTMMCCPYCDVRLYDDGDQLQCGKCWTTFPHDPADDPFSADDPAAVEAVPEPPNETWQPTEGPGSGDDRYRFRPAIEQMREQAEAWRRRAANGTFDHAHGLLRNSARKVDAWADEIESLAGGSLPLPLALDLDDLRCPECRQIGGAHDPECGHARPSIEEAQLLTDAARVLRGDRYVAWCPGCARPVFDSTEPAAAAPTPTDTPTNEELAEAVMDAVYCEGLQEWWGPESDRMALLTAAAERLRAVAARTDTPTPDHECAYRTAVVEIEALNPRDFMGGQDHLTAAFREPNFREAFSEVCRIVNGVLPTAPLAPDAYPLRTRHHRPRAES